MKRRILWEIIFSFLAVVLISVSVMAFFTGLAARKTYSNFVHSSDRLAAEKYAELFRESDISLQELREFFKSRQNMMSGMMQPGNRFMLPMHRDGFPMRTIISDLGGKVVFDSDQKKARPALVPEKGIKLKLRNGEEVRLFTGSMINPDFTSRDQEYIRQINKAIFSAFTVSLISAMILAFFIARRISSPVLLLSNAAAGIAAGDFKNRVSIKRNDEIGGLASNFNIMAESLQKDAELKKNMFSDAAHELRTPVTLMQNRIEMMIDGIYKADKKNLQKLFDDSLQLTKLVDDLQSLYDAEQGGLEYRKTDIDLSEILRMSTESFKSRFSRLDIKVVEEFEENVPHISADPKRIMQVFHNLLENALSFSPPESSVIIRCTNRSNSVMIEIEDEGPGIPKRERAMIFKRFYRIDPSRSRNTGGSGLGLTICKRILQAHDAEISADEGKKGALFRIIFPLAGS